MSTCWSTGALHVLAGRNWRWSSKTKVTALPKRRHAPAQRTDGIVERLNVIAAVQEKYLGNYVRAFGDFQKSAAASELPWLRKLREDAFAQFAETGFPTNR